MIKQTGKEVNLQNAHIKKQLSYSTVLLKGKKNFSYPSTNKTNISEHFKGSTYTEKIKSLTRPCHHMALASGHWSKYIYW